MKLAYGNLWDFYREGSWICVTTNGFVKTNGDAVMGRGCASQALSQLGVSGVAAELGAAIKAHGNHLYHFQAAPRVLAFPVKHNWWESANLTLIERSAKELTAFQASQPEIKEIYLPRPGCGNGRLLWVEVEEVLKPILDNRVIVLGFPADKALGQEGN